METLTSVRKINRIVRDGGIVFVACEGEDTPHRISGARTRDGYLHVRIASHGGWVPLAKTDRVYEESVAVDMPEDYAPRSICGGATRERGPDCADCGWEDDPRPGCASHAPDCPHATALDRESADAERDYLEGP